MIRLTRLNGSEMWLNADLVASIEEHHDTVVTLVDGKTYVVADKAIEVVRAVTTYRGSVLAAAERLITEGADEQADEPAPPAQVLHLHRDNDATGGL